MKKVFTALLAFLVLSLPALAATSQVNNIGQQGAGVNPTSGPVTIPFSNIAKSICLNFGGQVGSFSSGNYFNGFSMSSPASATPYTVPGGEVLYITSVETISNTASTVYLYGYGTAALSAEATGTPPTGSIAYGSTASGYWSSASSTSANTYLVEPVVGVSFPAASFPWVKMQSTQTLNVKMCGVLVP